MEAYTFPFLYVIVLNCCDEIGRQNNKYLHYPHFTFQHYYFPLNLILLQFASFMRHSMLKGVGFMVIRSSCNAVSHSSPHELHPKKDGMRDVGGYRPRIISLF